MTATRVPVTRRAVLQRLNRHLGPDERIRVRRGCGRLRRRRYDHLDLRRGTLACSFTDLGTVARDLGVLKPYETLSA